MKARLLTILQVFAVTLTMMFAAPCFGQKVQLLSNDAKALVSRVELSSGESITLQENQAGAVWISLDPLVVITKKNGLGNRRTVERGKWGNFVAEEQSKFESANGAHAKLIVVMPKIAHQGLTTGPFLNGGSLEDASDRNSPLLVAILSCRFSQTKNIGDESEWRSGKRTVIAMKAGDVHWVHGGTYHFKNLGPSAAQLISMEW